MGVLAISASRLVYLGYDSLTGRLMMLMGR